MLCIVFILETLPYCCSSFLVESDIVLRWKDNPKGAVVCVMFIVFSLLFYRIFKKISEIKVVNLEKELLYEYVYVVKTLAKCVDMLRNEISRGSLKSKIEKGQIL